MYAVKDGINFWCSPWAVEETLKEGYEFYDEDMKKTDDPIAEAKKEIEENTHTATIEEFIEYCKENGILVENSEEVNQ